MCYDEAIKVKIIVIKKMKIDQSNCLNSTSSNTIEAAILDLEEPIWRVKWLKHILEFGMPSSDILSFSWKFMEYRGSLTPKIIVSIEVYEMDYKEFWI